jgi:hypothetical protein
MPREGRASSTPRPIVSTIDVSGILDHPPQCAIAHKAGDDDCKCVSDLAAHSARGLHLRLPSSEIRGRREDRVLAAPAVPRAICANKTAHEHTGQRETLRPSLRNGFTAYFVLFPENGSFASVACASYRTLNASTAAPEPHDFTVRVRRVRLARPQRPPHLTARS